MAGAIDAKGRFWVAEIDKKVRTSSLFDNFGETDGLDRQRRWDQEISHRLTNRRDDCGGMILMGACIKWIAG